MTVIDRFNTDEWVQCGAAAKVAGVSRDWMRKLAESGRVEAVRIDGLWFVKRAAAAAFVRDPVGRGRPPAKRRGRRPAR